MHSTYRAGVARLVVVLAALAWPLGAQAPTVDRGIVLRTDWTQANALPLNRNAVHSGEIGLSLRRQSWAVDASWVRIARDLSTVQGVALTAGPLLRWRQVLFIPAIGLLGGQAQESRDSTGYDYTCPACTTQPTSGHQPRYSYSSAATFGGGGSLAIELPLFRALGFRALAQQWYFSGAPLDGDRARTVIGAGLSLRVGR